MKIIRIVGTLLSMVLASAMLMCSAFAAPERIPAVPMEAIWAGGVDGGAWILCNVQADKSYFCSVYNDHNGDLTAQGKFLLRHVTVDTKNDKLKIIEIDNSPSKLNYSHFDGIFINLKTEKNALVPDGWIVYPLGEDSGKKRLYKHGHAVSDEIQY